MRITQIGVRAGLVVAAAALPSALGTTAAVAAGELTVAAAGSAGRVTIAACPDGGTAALTDRGRAIRAGARQAEPTRGSGPWQYVAAGTRAAPVADAGGTRAEPPGVPAGGITPTSAPTTSSTTMPTSAPTATMPTTSPATAPARGVRGGVGGGSEDRGTLALAAGGVLVAVAAGAGLWQLRRRGARGRT